MAISFFIIYTTSQIWDFQRNRWQGDTSSWLRRPLQLPWLDFSWEKQFSSLRATVQSIAAESSVLGHLRRAWARGNFAHSALLLCSRQPGWLLLGRDLWQEGTSVCSGQHVIPTAKPRDCPAATGVLCSGLGICKVNWSSATLPTPKAPCDGVEGTQRSLLVLLCLN